MPVDAEALRRAVAASILESNLATNQAHADTLAAKLIPSLAVQLAATPAPEPAPAGHLMTAAEALFVRDTVAAELENAGGAAVAERLIVAGYIDVGPILLRHRMVPQDDVHAVAAATGPLQVPGAPSSATETGRIARGLGGLPSLPDFPRGTDDWGDSDD